MALDQPGMEKILKNRTVGGFLVAACVVLLVISGYLGYTIISNSASNTIGSTVEKNPIIKHLPYKTAFYSISYDISTEDEVTIKVFTSLPYQRKIAIDTLNQFESYATSKYKVVFEDFDNPLREK